MPASLATVASLLKEIYEPKLRDQLNNDTVAYSRILKTSDGITSNVGGKYVTFPVHTRRNAGIGARNENEVLPVAGQQGFAAGRVGLKFQYGQIQLTGQTIELAQSNPQAFVSALDQEVNGLKNDLRKDLNRQFFSDGTGKVATCTTANASGNTFTTTFTAWAQIGMQVDIIQSAGIAAGTVFQSNRQITAITPATASAPNGVITLSGAAFASAVGDILTRTGSVNREWTGIGSIIRNTGTLYNIDPTVEPTWKSEILNNSGTNRPLSEGLMIQMVDQLRINGGKPTVIFQSLGVRRAYFYLLNQQRSVVNTQEFSGGFKGLAFTTDTGEIPVIADIDCPSNTQFYVNEDEIKLYREEDWKFMDRDGSMWQRVITSAGAFDAYQATMYQYSDLGTHRRNTHGVLADITEG